MKKPKEALERNTTSVSVRLDNDLVAWLDDIALAENRTRANVIDTLVKQARAARSKP